MLAKFIQLSVLKKMDIEKPGRALLQNKKLFMTGMVFVVGMIFGIGIMLLMSGHKATIHNVSIKPPKPVKQQSAFQIIKKDKLASSFVYQVKSGNTLSGIFHSLSIPSKQLQTLLHDPLFFTYFHQLQPKEKLAFEFEKQHRLKSLTIPLGSDALLIVKNQKQHLRVRMEKQTTLTKSIEVSGTISDSLFKSMQSLGLSDRIIMKFIHVFSEDLNLHAIHKDDSFSVIYAASFKKNKLLKTKLLAGKLTLSGKSYYAILDGQGFYNLHGLNWAKAFMRTPVHYVFISSGFSLRRYHPILHIYRPHFGVDLAANKGTPIEAASNGKIIYAGKMDGYGNVIILRYNHIYSTRYAHMEKFAKGIHDGKYVKEGKIIGYVGETGLATGPHLHYEFRIHDKPVNPMTVKLPRKPGLYGKNKTLFENYAQNLTWASSRK